MKNSILRKAIAIWIFWGGIVLADAEARTVRMVYIEAPPFYYTDGKGNPQGFLIELMSKVAQKAGYEMESVSFPAKRMAHKLINGEADIWLGVSTIPAFQGKTLVGKIEIINVVLNVYYGADQKAFRDKEDFLGKTVIILRGYSYGGLIEFIKDPANRVTSFETGSHESAFKMLRGGRADYLLDYEIPANRILKTIHIPGLQYARLSSVPLKLVVSRKTPNAATILQDFENAYKDLVHAGQIRME